MSTVAGAPVEVVEARRVDARYPIALFLGSRAVVWAFAALLLWLLHPQAPSDSIWQEPWLHDVGRYVDIWGRWDGAWYTRIAAHGYHTDQNAAAFHPLYPLLVAAAGRMLDGHYLVGGILVSLLCGTAAFVLLRRLVAERYGEEIARRTLVYVAVFPASLFFGAVYTESLFLLLAVAMFLLAERGRILEASIICGLGLLTRPSAVALLPALLLYAWRERDRLRACLSILAAPLLFALFPLDQWLQLGTPFRFLHAERAWGRHLSPAGLYDAVRMPLHDLGHGERTDAVLNVEALAYLLVFALLVYLAWRLLERPWALFAAASLVVPLAEPDDRWPLMSLPRFMAVVFPLFVALAVAVDDRRRRRMLVVAGAAVLLVSVARWTLYHWVA